MGRGDNRRTQKVKQRKGWRRKKRRLAAKIEAGKAGRTGAKKKAAPAGSTVRRTAAEPRA